MLILNHTNKLLFSKKISFFSINILLFLKIFFADYCLAENGVFSKNIVLATHQPLSGPAQEFSKIGKSANAFFKYVNDQGGVHGRSINLKIIDDLHSKLLIFAESHRGDILSHRAPEGTIRKDFVRTFKF